MRYLILDGTVLVRWAAALLLALGSFTASAENLLDVYKLALEYDPLYLGAGATNRAAQEQIPQARAELLPDANLSGRYSTVGQDTREVSGAGGLGFTKFDEKVYSLDITQPIFAKDLLIGLGQADIRVQQANAVYAFELQDLMVRTAELYFNVLVAEDQVDNTRAARDANEQQLKQSQQRFDVGLIAITDVDEAKAGFDLANAALITAENDLDNAREALRELTGVYLVDLEGLRADSPLTTPQPNDIDDWTAVALEQNLELLAVNLAATDSREEIQRQAAGHVPTVDLVASHRYDDVGGRFGESNIVTSSIGVQFNVPIYQGGEVLSRTREARQLYQRALDDLERQRRITQREARDSFRGVISGISSVNALAQAVVSTESALEAIEAGFQVGTRTSVDVLDAQRDLYQAKFNHSEARYLYTVDILRLKRSAGTLSQNDLREINDWLGE